MSKITPIKAYAVVNKKKPKLDPMEIYRSNDIHLEKDEKLVKVIISINE